MGNITVNQNGGLTSTPVTLPSILFTSLVVVNAGTQNATTNGFYTVIELAPAVAIAATTVNLIPSNGVNFVTGESVVLTLAALANTVASVTITTSTGIVVIPSPNTALAVGTGSITLKYNGTSFIAA